MVLNLSINSRGFLTVWYIWATCFVISCILVFIQSKLDKETYDDMNDVEWTRLYLLGPLAVLVLLIGIIITILINCFDK